MRTSWISLMILFPVLLAGCGPFRSSEQPSSSHAQDDNQAQGNPSQTPIPNPSGNPLQSTSTPESNHTGSVSVDKFIALAKQDLAERLKIEADQISVPQVIEIIWPDAALGCPSPGQFYAQGTVPGYRIRLEAEGRAYDYHTDLTGRILLCPEPDPDEHGPPPGATSGPTQQIGVPIK